MSLVKKDLNRHLVREITVILIIKIIILLTIKHFWFDAPTIPKNFDHQVAEHIAGSSQVSSSLNDLSQINSSQNNLSKTEETR